MGKTVRSNGRGGKVKPTSKEQKKKPSGRKRFHAKGSGQKYGDRGGWGGMYPKHLADQIRNPEPPLDE